MGGHPLMSSFLGNVTAPSSRLLGVQASKTLCMVGLFEAYGENMLHSPCTSQCDDTPDHPTLHQCVPTRLVPLTRVPC